MAPKIKEIYYLPIKLGEVSYNRPCVVIYVGDNSATIGLLSSAMDLYNDTMDFLIYEDHLDFRSTGLKKSSFVKGSPLVDVSLSLFGSPIGILVGGLADEYDKWIS